MYATTSPTGASVSIPADVSEDHNYFTSSEMSQATGYLREYGYVVLRGLVSRSACQAAQSAVAEELSRYRGYLYRQTTSHPEVHDFNEQRFVMNPILNVQDVPSAALPRFHSSALEILTSDGVQQFLRTHFDEPGKLVQSMYFHGNTATGAHQDTYYLDAENIGTMVAGWFALEDIQPGAGRFYVYPTSHRIDVQKNGGDFDIAFNHNRYKTLIIELIDKYGLECRAPALQQGDVLFWNSKTIHGSLGTTQPQFSRSSFTAHYIPESDRKSVV